LPPLRAELRQVWRWFGDLSATRRFTSTVEPEADAMGHGLAWRTHSRPEPFSYPDIMAWCEACGLCLSSWQLAALTLMDEIYRNAVEKPQEKLPDIPATVSNIRTFLQVLGLKKKT
jgi:hypothetical protein